MFAYVEKLAYNTAPSKRIPHQRGTGGDKIPKDTQQILSVRRTKTKLRWEVEMVVGDYKKKTPE